MVHALKTSIKLKTRFGDVIADKSTQWAAVIHPKFKLVWVEDPVEKF